jgi:hypothetical protein
MKKGLLTGFSFILVLSILLASTGAVLAAPLNGGPSISAPSGGGTVTLTTIAVSKLPGTEANAAGTLFPVGHTNGDMMFSGDGVQVSGLVGYATLSLPLANFSAGWNGSIYQWLNNTWVKIPTTTSQDAESADGTASATIYSDGIYALIVEYKLPDVATDGKCPKGVYLNPAYISYAGHFWLYGIAIAGYSKSGWIAEGDSYTYEITNISEDSGLEGPMSGTVNISYVYDGGTYFAGVTLLPSSDYSFYYSEVIPTFTLVVHIKGCTLSAKFPEDFANLGGGVG